jgi:hypothetical protein
VGEINTAATAWLLVTLGLYAAAVTLSRLLRTAMTIAATVLLLSFLLNPQQPWVFADQVCGAARGPLLHLRRLLQIGFAVGQRRWALVISVVAQ